MNILIKNIFFSCSSELITYGLSFALSIIIARLLGAEGNGKYWVIFNGVGLLSILFSFRFQRSITYHLACKEENLSEIFGFGVLIIFFSTLSIGIFAKFGNIILDNTVLKNANLEWYIIAAIAYSRNVEKFIVSTTEGFFFFKLKAVLILFEYSLRCIITIIVCGYYSLDFNNLIIILSIGEAICFTAIFSLIIFKAKKKISFNLHIIKKLLKYSIKSYIGMVSDIVTLRLDSFILNYFYGAKEVGIYSIAISISSVLLYIPNATRNVLMPYISKYKKTNLTSYIVKLFGFSMIILGIILIVITWYFISFIYGDSFVSGRILVCILVPGTIFWGLFAIIASELEARNLPEIVSGIGLVVAIITIILDLIVIPLLGAIGAATVSSITYTIAFVIIRKKYFELRIENLQLTTEDK
jgi:O-antigen/teichoic acid export membrane protein